MKTVHSLFASLLIAVALLLCFALDPPHARSQTTDSNSVSALVAQAVDVQMEQDSIEASATVLVPMSREILRVAKRERLPPALLAAFIQEESGFNPWAGREEPGYLKKKTIITQAALWSKHHKGIPTALTELSDRSRSFGPMQIMGQVAREQGYDSMYLASLYSPFNSIGEGAKLLKKKLAAYPTDTLSAISAYNQGNNRKKHGSFVNARYVYRVTTAWEAYDRLFSKKKVNSNENRVENRAGSAGAVAAGRLNLLDTTDTTAHGAAAFIGYGSDDDPSNHSRYDVAAGANDPRVSQQARDAGGAIVACSFIAGLFGLYLLDRYLGRRTGLAAGVLQPADGFFRSKSSDVRESAHAR